MLQTTAGEVGASEMGIVKSLVCGTTLAVFLCLWPPGLVNGLDGAGESEDQNATGYLVSSPGFKLVVKVS